MKYVFYPDAFWVMNFAMDALVLLLVRQLSHPLVKVRRILLSAGFGATASVILFLWLPGLSWYQLCIHVVINPIMILFGFGKKNPKKFAENMFWAYVMTLLLGGVLNVAVFTLGQWRMFAVWALGGFGLSMIILQRIRECKQEWDSYEILLLTNQKTMLLAGFLDTGNLLTDPIMKKPVHIIQEELLKEALTKEQLPIRYIPFHSLGREDGLLPVVTLKAMYVKRQGEGADAIPDFVDGPVFGLAKEKLFQNRDYQVILNATYKSL